MRKSNDFLNLLEGLDSDLSRNGKPGKELGGPTVQIGDKECDFEKNIH